MAEIKFPIISVTPYCFANDLSLVHNMTRRNVYARIEQISIQAFGCKLRRHASVGNGSEPASSELRVATRHIVNLALW